MSTSVKQKRASRAPHRPGLFCLQRLLRSARLGLAAPVVLAVGFLAGCAASTTKNETGGPGTGSKRPAISAGLRAEELTIHREVLASLHHDSDANVRYGTVPGDLRNKQAPPTDQVLNASSARPAMAIQGNGVVLHLAHGSATATAVGPDIPDGVQGSARLHTRATWDLTFDHVRGTVPISPRLFSITDEQGALLWPQLSVVGGGPLPRTVPIGHPFTLALKTVVSVGDGKLRYSPSGRGWLAEWDFDVETD